MVEASIVMTGSSEIQLVLPEVRIACVFNDAYAPHFAALAASLSATRGPEALHITVIADSCLTSKVIDTLEHYLATLNISMDVVKVPDAAIGKLPPCAPYPPLIWYRLLLPDLLPACAKVLYLDTDTLALQSLWPLFQEDLGTNVMGAIAEPATIWEDQCKLVGIDTTEGYLNSGVLLMNLKMMRDEGFTERALEIARTKSEILKLPDQEVLNLVTKGRWKKLHPKWNAISYLWLDPQAAAGIYSKLEYSIAAHSPAIVHFEGTPAVKPWHFRSIHPLREIYRQMRVQTPWPLKELEGRSPMAAMLRLLPLRGQYLIARSKTAIFKLSGLRR
ncbi:MAG: glycosyltransferase family 8 protein [Stenotrophobium sp.]